MYRDGRLPIARGEPCRLLLIHDLDDEELFAVLAVTRSEKLTTLEAFVVLVTLGYFGRGEPHGAGRRFVDRGC
jgi:hypothetical protein